jgi:hypothetical protein
MIRTDRRNRMPSRRGTRRSMLIAVCAASLPFQANSNAQEGVRELKSPSQMAEVAPLRAIGVRLTPAAPLMESATVIPTEATVIPTEAPVAPPLANSRKPERIAPKSIRVASEPKLAEVSTSAPLPPAVARLSETTPSVPVLPQAPIRLRFNNDEVETLGSPAAFAPSVRTSPKPGANVAPPIHLADVAQPAAQPAVQPLAFKPSEPPPLAPPQFSLPPQPSLVIPEFPAPVEIARSPIPSSLPAPLLAPRTGIAAVALAQPLSVEPSVPLSVEPTAEAPQAQGAPVPIALPASKVSNIGPMAPATEDPPRPPKEQVQLASSIAPPTYSSEELAKAMPVALESLGTREVPVEGSIRSLRVTDERVCRALASDGRVYLVGGELGETIVEVKSTTSEQVKLLRVNVVAPWQHAAHGVADLDQLHHALRPLCPDSNLVIRAQSDGSIVVQGKVDSNATAKRILELTRKLILVPVVDKLEVL